MSSEESSSPEPTAASPAHGDATPQPPPDSFSKARDALHSLSSFLPTIPSSLISSQDPASSLLHDHTVSSTVSAALRQPDSGAGDNNLCRWLYDTFQSGDLRLQLVVLRFLPTVVGLYLSRLPLRRPQAGFEAVLLALYAHETNARGGQSVTINIAGLSNASIYHECRGSPGKTKNAAAAEDQQLLNVAVISPALEPHGTVKSTRRARIIGVSLELYHSKISLIPDESKIEFCEFCEMWSGYHQEQDQEQEREDGERDKEKKGRKKREGGRIVLPWELWQPILRILGHCVMLEKKGKGVFEAACAACRSLHGRAMQDINPKAILAAGSLVRLSKMVLDSKDDFDYTEIAMTEVISL